MKHPVRISVLAGSFESQPLVFAHLWDVSPDLDLGEVDVICRVDPGLRLAHYFDPATCAQIEDALGLADTVVLVFEEAGPTAIKSDMLRAVGMFEGHRQRQGPV